MRKKDFYRFLDDPNPDLESSLDEETLQLFKQLETLPEEEPGEDYWQGFNHRLQARLEGLPKKPKPWYAGGWMLWATLASAAVLLWVMLPLRSPASPRLEDLSQTELAFMSELFQPQDELFPDSDLVSDTEAFLFEEMELEIWDNGLFEEDIINVNPEELKSQWSLEG